MPYGASISTRLRYQPVTLNPFTLKLALFSWLGGKKTRNPRRILTASPIITLHHLLPDSLVRAVSSPTTVWQKVPACTESGQALRSARQPCSYHLVKPLKNYDQLYTHTHTRLTQKICHHRVFRYPNQMQTCRVALAPRWHAYVFVALKALPSPEHSRPFRRRCWLQGFATHAAAQLSSLSHLQVGSFP